MKLPFGISSIWANAQDAQPVVAPPPKPDEVWPQFKIAKHTLGDGSERFTAWVQYGNTCWQSPWQIGDAEADGGRVKTREEAVALIDAYKAKMVVKTDEEVVP